jgi:hypothetical protein
VTEHKNSFQNGNRNSAGILKQKIKKIMLTILKSFFWDLDEYRQSDESEKKTKELKS